MKKAKYLIDNNIDGITIICYSEEHLKEELMDLQKDGYEDEQISIYEVGKKLNIELNTILTIT